MCDVTQQQELLNRVEKGVCSIHSGPDMSEDVWWVAMKLDSGKWEFQDAWQTFAKANEASKFHAAHNGLPTMLVRTNPGDNKAAVLRSVLAMKGMQ